jgi:hypothetical protein
LASAAEIKVSVIFRTNSYPFRSAIFPSIQATHIAKAYGGDGEDQGGGGRGGNLERRQRVLDIQVEFIFPNSSELQDDLFASERLADELEVLH